MQTGKLQIQNLKVLNAHPIGHAGVFSNTSTGELYIAAGGSGIAVSGGAFITNVVPTGAGNVGTKVYDADGVVLQSCASDTQLVTVSVLGITGSTHYKPVMTLMWGAHTQVVPMVAGADKPVFTGSAAIDLQGETTISILHEDGATTSCLVSSDTPPVIVTAQFTGAYPGVQTELKLADTFQFNVITDVAITKVEFADYGAYSAQVFTVASGTNQTVTGVIANRGTIVQSLGAKVRVQKATGSYSVWHLTESDGSTDASNLVQLNNLYPTVSCGAITYPGAQGALKNAEDATVVNTVTNYTTVNYTTPNGDLTIANPTTVETPKTVTRLAGSYNIATPNFTITAHRAANNTSATSSTVVKIANVACTVAITLPAARLTSGGADGTVPQNHTVTLTANQVLAGAPSLVAGMGVWQGGGFVGGGTTYTRAIQIADTDAKGAYNFSSVSATNLAGIITNTITSGAAYVVGGFASRNITLAAFMHEATMNVAATDYTKIVLSWSVKPSLTIRSPLNSTPPVVDNWCLVSLGPVPVTIRLLDTSSTDSSSADSIITIEELA